MKNLIKYFRITVLALLCTFITVPQLQAQNASKIRAVKIKYIQEKLKLTQQQEHGFWPLYNNYQDEVKAIRTKYLDAYNKSRSTPRDRVEAIEYVNNNIEYQEKVLDVKKRYNDLFLKVISAQQLARLYDVEKDFKAELIKRINAGEL